MSEKYYQEILLSSVLLHLRIPPLIRNRESIRGGILIIGGILIFSHQMWIFFCIRCDIFASSGSHVFLIKKTMFTHFFVLAECRTYKHPTQTLFKHLSLPCKHPFSVISRPIRLKPGNQGKSSFTP